MSQKNKINIEEQSMLDHQENVTLLARIDTGVATNSMFVIDTNVFEINGKKLIRFKFLDHNNKRTRDDLAFS